MSESISFISGGDIAIVFYLGDDSTKDLRMFFRFEDIGDVRCSKIILTFGLV